MSQTTFQQELANELLAKYNGDLSSLVIIFPSLRARTFFNDALASIHKRPIWQPRWLSIDDIMEQASGLRRGERIRLISELHHVYSAYHTESFDKFYFWGDMLINDFDMIDRYMIDAMQLLRNIEDIKELEADVSYLTPEQLRIIAFWRSIGDSDSLSEHKLRFLRIWRTLPQIYNEYKARLAKLGIAYPGMIYRTTAERIKRGEEIPLPQQRFIIAGFNALSGSEKILFDYIATRPAGAEFYWDYDSYYTTEREWHEAGMFMRDNIIRYPAGNNITTNNFLGREKHIESIACVSNIAQCKYVSKILESLPKEELDKHTAIVLTDENMLIPLIHSLPESIDKVNVTMGYPLKNSIVYSFIERIIALQAHSRAKDDEAVFYHMDVTGLLSHPYISAISTQETAELLDEINNNRIISIKASTLARTELLGQLFSRHTDWGELGRYIASVLQLIAYDTTDKLQCEYLRIAHDETMKLIRSIEQCNRDISVEIFTSLLRRHLQTISMPYVGEPLEGIQIMGILETRNIDFKNVIILSMTDDTFPGDKTGQSSFIPYNLRAAYGMPTPEEHEAMYAYYFYRLIQRAERVSMLYCSRADEKSTGERSRYIYQLEYETPFNITKRSVGVDLSLGEDEPIEVAKGAIEQRLLDRYLNDDQKHTLSPTALFRYIECPLKFYFNSIAKLRVQDEVSDTIDAPMFGNILHESMEELYKPLIGKKNPMQEISKLCKRDIVERAVDKTIGRLLLNDESATTSDFTGDTLLVRDIIIKYILRGIMRYDSSQEGFTIVSLEDDQVMCRYEISNGRKVNLSGRADRLDRLPNGTMQIIDYKSGNTPHLEFNGMNSLFTGEAKERISNIFQTLLYSMMLSKRNGVDTVPSLYFAAKMHDDKYSPMIINKESGEVINSYHSQAEEFEQLLSETLEELFDYNTPFKQVEDVEMCKYCDYKRICRR